MKKRVFAKLMILLTAVVLLGVSCMGPRPCWGVSVEAEEPDVTLTEVVEA